MEIEMEMVRNMMIKNPWIKDMLFDLLPVTLFCGMVIFMVTVVLFEMAG